jgi:3-phenylpropionate/trans-cinnamate dioxygenase ferredoxin component
VARTGHVPPGGLTAIEVDGHRVCLARTKYGTIYAIDDACTHEGASLSEGDIIHEDWVQCPFHSSLFDLRTGQVKGLPATMPTRTYRVTVDGDEILVDL